MKYILIYLFVSHRSVKLYFFFILFSSRSSDLIISITLSSSLLMLSFTCSGLLVKFFSFQLLYVFISVIVHYYGSKISVWFLFIFFWIFLYFSYIIFLISYSSLSMVSFSSLSINVTVVLMSLTSISNV